MSAKNCLLVNEYEFTATISSGYKPMNFPCQYSLSWKQGLEKITSEKTIPSREDGVMNFDDEIKIVTKIAHNTETKEYEKKKSTICINYKTEHRSEFRQMGHLSINLGEWVQNEKLNEFIEHSLDKDKEAKLSVRINCVKLRDANIIGYQGDVTPLIKRVEDKQGSFLQRSGKFSERSASKIQSAERQPPLSPSRYAIQKLNQQLQSSMSKIKDQEKRIRDLERVQQQLTLTQVDLQGRNKDLQQKLFQQQSRYQDLQMKFQEFLDIQSQFQNLKWQNAQLKSELQTTRKIYESRVHEDSTDRIDEKNINQLQQVQLNCIELMDSIKQRQLNRKILQQKYLTSEQQCRNLADLLEQKNVQVMSLKQKINTLKSTQFSTPVKPESPVFYQTHEIGIQHEEKKQFLTPQTKKQDEHQEYSRQSKKLLQQLQLKNQEINQLTCNLSSVEKVNYQTMERSKKDEEEIEKLNKQMKELNDEILYLKDDIWAKDRLLEESNEILMSKRGDRTKPQKIQELENENKQLSSEIQYLIQQNTKLQENVKLINQKFQLVQQQLQQKQQQVTPSKQPASNQNFTSCPHQNIIQELTLEKSKVTQLTHSIEHLKQSNKLFLQETKEQRQQNDKLRSKLFDNEMIIQSLKKQIKLDGQQLGLVKLQLQKQKAICQNIETHLHGQKIHNNDLMRQIEKGREQYERVRNQLEEMILKKSRKRERKERSRIKHENEIKVLSDEVLRVNKILYEMRMEEEAREAQEIREYQNIPKKQQKQDSKISSFAQQAAEQQLSNIQFKQLQAENANLRQLCNTVDTMQIFKQKLLQIANTSSHHKLLSLLAQKKRSADTKLLHYNDLKAWIDEKLHEASGYLQKTKSSLEFNRSLKQKLIKDLRPVQECIAQILQKPICY